MSQKIAFSKDGGTTFTDIDFTPGVWDYEDIDKYIKEKTKQKMEMTMMSTQLL